MAERTEQFGETHILDGGRSYVVVVDHCSLVRDARDKHDVT
jgi:hypothetical protein